MSSAVYIFNDYRDVEKDRKHPTKKNRPLASGKIKPQIAMIISAVCFGSSIIISMLMANDASTFCLLLYGALNIAYSMGLKNKPIIDIVILASGFVLRVFYGGHITNSLISKWLYLVVVTGSLYLGLGKRRNELKSQTDTREVLKYYNEAFLEKNMYVCVALANVFYSLWAMEMSDTQVSWTIPVIIVIFMCYSLDVEGDSDGDPVEVILKDKIMLAIIIFYVISVFLLLYIM